MKVLLIIAFLLPSIALCEQYAIDRESIQEGLKDCWELKSELRMDFFGNLRLTDYAEKTGDCFELVISNSPNTAKWYIELYNFGCFSVSSFDSGGNVLSDEVMCNE